jgi:hypothetical protein
VPLARHDNQQLEYGREEPLVAVAVAAMLGRVIGRQEFRNQDARSSTMAARSAETSACRPMKLAAVPTDPAERMSQGWSRSPAI